MPSFFRSPPPAALRTAALGLAVLLSFPNALHPPPVDHHPGFTHAFAWMAYSLAPWSALLPFAVVRAKWPALVASVLFLGAAVFWRSAPLGALGCAITVAPMLDELPSSTVLSVGVLVLGGLIAHDLMPTAKLLARSCGAVSVAIAITSYLRLKYRGPIVAGLAVIAAVLVHVVHR